MARKLRLLIDEGVDQSVRDWIREYGRLKVKDVHELRLRATCDDRLVKIATDDNRILVVIDKGFSAENYPICTHSGIIRICVKPRIEDEMIRVFKEFLQSGCGDKCQHAIVTLKSDHFEIMSQSGIERYAY